MPDSNLETLLNEFVDSLSRLEPKATTPTGEALAAPVPIQAGQQEAITNSLSTAAPGRLTGSPPPPQPSATLAAVESPELVIQLIDQMAQLRATGQGHIDGLLENTKALADSSASRASSSTQQTVVNAAKSFGLSALGSPVISLIEGIAGLFKHDPPPAQALTKFDFPAPVNFQGAVSPNGQLSAYDYNASGQIRPYGQPLAAQGANTNVTVQVQAFDSKSFMDHSGEIAQAVRQALLQNHALSDVVNDL